MAMLSGPPRSPEIKASRPFSIPRLTPHRAYFGAPRMVLHIVRRVVTPRSFFVHYSSSVRNETLNLAFPFSRYLEDSWQALFRAPRKIFLVDFASRKKCSVFRSPLVASPPRTAPVDWSDSHQYWTLLSRLCISRPSVFPLKATPLGSHLQPHSSLGKWSWKEFHSLELCMNPLPWTGVWAVAIPPHFCIFVSREAMAGTCFSHSYLLCRNVHWL